MAFCGIPEPSVDICMGALPAATLRTVKKKKKRNLKCFRLKITFRPDTSCVSSQVHDQHQFVYELEKK